MSKLYVVVALLVLADPVLADWWRTYEASEGTFPEQQDWYRDTASGGGQRSFENGAFVLDTLAAPGIMDFYVRGMPSLPDANDATQQFNCEWELRVDTLSGLWNPEMFAGFQGHGDIALEYRLDRIYSLHEDKYIADFAPGVFHSYKITTSDLVSYTLAIDGTVVYTGAVSPWCPASWVQFADAGTGDASASRWRYVRFGVTTIPEPTGFLLLVAAAAGFRNRWTRRYAL